MEGVIALVPEDFVVPDGLHTDRVELRMLGVNDLIKDYDAVMSSVDHLRSTYSRVSGSDWPLGLTLEEDLVDLGWHQREFTLRSSFAYTVMSPDGSTCLGCVYINPSRKRVYDASVTMWVRAAELDTGLDRHLYESVKAWLAERWPFAHPAYPGREIAAETWRALPDTDHRDSPTPGATP